MIYEKIENILNLPDCKILLGNITNKCEAPLEKYLTENEIVYYEKLKTSLKKKQFKLLRILRTMSLGLSEIKYKDFGAPYLLDQNNYISISHKNNYVVFGYSTFKIGLDIEEISGKVKKVRSKFLTDHELNEFSNETDLVYTQLWAAKEAIYKIMTPPLSFKNDIQISKDHKGLIIGKILNGQRIINLNYLKYNNYILCYVLL
jgi:phosphopantetheinyl transferase